MISQSSGPNAPAAEQRTRNLLPRPDRGGCCPAGAARKRAGRHLSHRRGRQHDLQQSRIPAHIRTAVPGTSPDAWAERVHPDDRSRMERAWADFCRHPVPSRFAAIAPKPRRNGPSFLGAGGPAPRVLPAGWAPSPTSPIWSPRATTCAERRPCSATPSTRRRIGIVYADRSGKILRFNPRSAPCWASTPAISPNRTMGDFTLAEDVARVSAELERLWNGDVAIRGSREALRPQRRQRRSGCASTTALVREAGAAARVLGRVPARHQRPQGHPAKSSNGCTSS